MNDRTYTLEELAEMAFHSCHYCEFYKPETEDGSSGYCRHFRIDTNEHEGTRCECFVRRAS